MSGTVSTRWYFSDWMSDPNVRACSLAARGLWMDMLCIASANKGRDHGFVMIGGKGLGTRELARMVGSIESEVADLVVELEQNQVFSRDRRGVIYCRRMVRSEKNRINGRLGGNPDFGSKPNQRTGSVPASLRTKRRAFSDEERQYIFNAADGKCHWCKTALMLDWPYKDPPPENYMHIDHLVAICDGGTNEAANLVGSCRVCNASRSLTVSDGNDIKIRNRPPVSPKAHIPEPEPDPEEQTLFASVPADGWPEDFLEQFWTAFPPYRREAKRKVGEKLARLRRDKTVAWDVLIGAVQRFAATNPGEFAPAPIVWLNGERWDRVYGAAGANGSNGNATNRNGSEKLGFAGIAARVRYGAEAPGPVARPAPEDLQPIHRR